MVAPIFARHNETTAYRVHPGVGRVEISTRADLLRKLNRQSPREVGYTISQQRRIVLIVATS